MSRVEIAELKSAIEQGKQLDVEIQSTPQSAEPKRKRYAVGAFAEISRSAFNKQGRNIHRDARTVRRFYAHYCPSQKRSSE